jgi:uncharacterized protein YxjI
MFPSHRHERDAVDQAQRAFAVPRETGPRRRGFLVWEKRLPIGNDYVIELDPGGPVFHVDGRLLRVRESLTITDEHGAEALRIQGQLLDARNVLAVVRDGVTLATVRKQADEAGGELYVVDLPGAERVEVLGDPAERAYRLAYRTAIVATISKAWRPLRTGYHARVVSEQDDAVVLAVTVCLDVMSRP